MVRSQRKQGENDVYHVVARGVSRSIIFEDDADRKQFLDTLASLSQERGAAVYAWCLMDNHYHILVKQELDLLSGMMKGLNSSYALYFNARHDRVGHLFQGRFKSEPVDTDEYFLTVLRYIHQNPVKAGITPTCYYRWSSYGEYLSGSGLVDAGFALGLLGGREEFKRFHAVMDVTAACCDADRSRRLICENDAMSVAKSVLGGIPLGSVSGFAKQERDEAIRKLRAAHLSIRQIERLTGVSRGIVAKVGK